MDGVAAAAALRARGDTTPILFLSALGQVDDRVDGQRAGGDDYLVKPYAFAEQLARLEALARRRPEETQTELKVADLEIDLLTRRVTRAGQVIELQPREGGCHFVLDLDLTPRWYLFVPSLVLWLVMMKRRGQVMQDETVANTKRAAEIESP